MFTIDDQEREYPNLWLAMIAARIWMLESRRSVIIYRNGEQHRLLRY